MRVTVEQIDREREEALIVRCHDPGAAWVEGVMGAASGQQAVCGWREGALHRLKLSEIFCFEVVLSNGEKVVVSRRYVAELKRMLGV